MFKFVESCVIRVMCNYVESCVICVMCAECFCMAQNIYFRDISVGIHFKIFFKFIPVTYYAIYHFFYTEISRLEKKNLLKLASFTAAVSCPLKRK